MFSQLFCVKRKQPRFYFFTAYQRAMMYIQFEPKEKEIREV